MLTEQKINKKLITNLRSAEKHLHTLAEEIGDLADHQEFPFIIAEVIAQKKQKDLTTEWVQKKYRLGYARASRLVEEVKKKYS